MNINISISSAPTILKKLAVVAYKATAPAVPVASLEFDPPHSSSRDFTLIVSSADTYIVNIYETAGLPLLGTLRHSFIYDPNYTDAEIREDEIIIISSDNEGDSSYTSTTWDGWGVQSIERRGFGTMILNTDYLLDLDVDGNATGFTLFKNGDVFQDGEIFIVSFKPRLTMAVASQSSPSLVSSELIISNDYTLTSSNSSSLIRLAGSTSVFDVYLPSIGTVAPFISYYFISTGGIHITSTINAYSGQFILFNGDIVSKIHLCQGEFLTLINNGIQWVVLNYSDSIRQAGQIVYDYKSGGVAYPAIIADGCENAATLLDRNIYRRLYDYVSSLLPLGSLISEASWSSNKGYYSNGDGLTNFRTPRLYSTGYLKAIPIIGEGAAGRTEKGKVGSHRHYLFGFNNSFGQGEQSNLYKNRAISYITSEKGDRDYAMDIASLASEENTDPYTMSKIQADLGLSSLPTTADGIADTIDTVRNITDNTGIFALIRI